MTDAGDNPLSAAELWHGFFDSTPQGVVVYRSIRDQEGGIVDFEWVAVNPYAREIMRLDEDQLLGKLMLEELPGLAGNDLFARYVSVVETGEPLELEQYISPRFSPDGREAWYAVTAVPANDGLIAMFTSITERKAVLHEAVQLMNHDDLTGVGNRRLIKARFWTRREKELPISLLYVDLDNFKVVNDAHGHQMGDEVLRITAKRLQRNIRPSEVVARIGGDEFAVLLHNHDESVVLHVAERLLKVLSRRINLRGTCLELQASIGAALYPEHGNSLEALLGHADQQMYQQKRRKSG